MNKTKDKTLKLAADVVKIKMQLDAKGKLPLCMGIFHQPKRPQNGDLE